MRYVVALLAALAAVEANPMPQAVTAMISPAAPAPSGCSSDYSGSFGIAVMTAGAACPTATEGSDGQPAAASEYTDGQPEQPVATEYSDGQPEMPMATATPVSQISDGQPQAPTAVSEISDGQPQAPTAVSEISDGQPQAPTSAVSQISDGQPQAPTSAVSQISDGQPQAPTSAVSQISDGQPQAPTSAVSQISDGQPQAPTAVTQSSDGQPEETGAPSSCATMTGCASDADLTLTLTNGVLYDSEGRQGYVASNYQFQFNSPPQAGSIYTAGFTICSNGSMALGGSTTFYQCLSGDFYNLYTEDIASYCSPVTIQAVMLVDC